ncbi:MAG: HhH-GPD-type base excision DNA repair protein [Acidimicrobiales bacterium]
MKGTLAVTGNPDADRLLATNPLALLMGMLLDQQVPMEWAFTSPFRLKERLGGELDATMIAAMDPAKLEDVFRQKPPLHRYPAAMAKRVHAVCQHLVEQYDGNAATIWEDAATAEELFARIRALPGYGDQKAKIFLALLGKRFGRAPAGWETYAGAYADTTPRSVADVDSAEMLQRVREFKRAKRAEGKSTAD